MTKMLLLNRLNKFIKVTVFVVPQEFKDFHAIMSMPRVGELFYTIALLGCIEKGDKEGAEQLLAAYVLSKK